MATTIIGEYNPPVRDRVENFGGNYLVYASWDNHRLINSAMGFPLPPDMPFNVFMTQVLPLCYNDHPDFANLDWDTIEVHWFLNGESFTPDLDKSLAENGVDHKSILRFYTPTLKGINGVGI